MLGIIRSLHLKVNFVIFYQSVTLFLLICTTHRNVFLLRKRMTNGATINKINIDNDKNHRVRYYVQQEPPKKSPNRNHESEGRRVSVLVISGEVLVEQNTEQVWFLFSSRDFLNLYLNGELFQLSYCHLPKVCHQFCLLCLNVHLNCLSLDNHVVSKQPQWQCHVTMTSQWGHVTKQILNIAGWGQIRRDQYEWFNHYLGAMQP